MGGNWQGCFGVRQPESNHPQTAIELPQAQQLLSSLARYPENFNINKKLKRFQELRQEMSLGRCGSHDWASGEALAMASILVDGYSLRLSGQDCERGTFSQRHSVLHDSETGAKYTPLRQLSPDQARLDIINSPLCEAGVLLGFEYGYSLDCPNGLVIWEAQFG